AAQAERKDIEKKLAEQQAILVKRNEEVAKAELASKDAIVKEQEARLNLSRLMGLQATEEYKNAQAEAMKEANGPVTTKQILERVARMNSPGAAFQASSLLQSKTFASGGIVSSPTRAMIGEAGPEAVIPLRGMARGRLRNPMSLGGRAAQQ